MARVKRGRFTVDREEPFVVFLIGMRINRIYAVHKWLPVFLAMIPMLSTLYRHPEKGFLGGQQILYRRGIGFVQYWRSFEDLERFARNPADPHLPAWRRFNRAVGSDGTVGIWHETYRIDPGRYEVVYGNMPPFGLAAATGTVAATGRRETARRRMGGSNAPAVPSPSQR